MIEQNGKAVIKISVIVLIITGIIGYSYYQSRNLINGPQISLTSPSTGATVNEPLVTVKGNAANISFITLNDRQIFIDNEGNFKEDLLLSPGYNVWTIEAKDKFGRVVSKKIELVLRNS
jgi:hypothetical protein